MNVYKGLDGVREFFTIHLKSLQMEDGSLAAPLDNFGTTPDPPQVQDKHFVG